MRDRVKSLLLGEGSERRVAAPICSNCDHGEHYHSEELAVLIPRVQKDFLQRRAWDRDQKEPLGTSLGQR